MFGEPMCSRSSKHDVAMIYLPFPGVRLFVVNVMMFLRCRRIQQAVAGCKFQPSLECYPNRSIDSSVHVVRVHYDYRWPSSLHGNPNRSSKEVFVKASKERPPSSMHPFQLCP